MGKVQRAEIWVGLEEKPPWAREGSSKDLLGWGRAETKMRAGQAQDGSWETNGSA